MGSVFKKIMAQFLEFYKGLGPTKKYALILSFLIGFITIMVITIMSSRANYAPLFTNIPQEQVPLLAAKLNEKNIPFVLQNDGRTISIPSNLIPATQMALMAELGTHKMGSIGLELFEKQDFGTSNYAQRVNYQRALQGELIRAINTLDSVRQSKVLLAIPAKKNFMEESGEPTASVVLQLHPGRALSGEQVTGIQNLVASSVEGMKPEKVSVVDERGKLLSRSGNEFSAQTGELMELKAKVEGEIENRIETMLAKIVGPNKVIAKVDAQLTSRTLQAVEELLDPDNVVIRSQQTQEESLDGARVNPSGVPGARANLPGAEDGGQVSFRQDVKKEIKTTNFEVPKTVRNIRELAGQLERLSVAVIVDGVYAPPAQGAEGQPSWTPRSAEELARYENLVRNAIGFNTQRGDQVKIESIQFVQEDFSDSERLLTTLERKQLLQSFLKWSLILVSLSLFFFLVVRPFIQWIGDSFQESVEDMLPRTIEELEELHSVDSTLPGLSSSLPVLEESIDPDKAEAELLKDRIMALMEQDDEKASNAFGMWMVKKESEYGVRQ